ncbi:rifin, partial [Plasmodium reichenowi]
FFKPTDLVGIVNEVSNMCIDSNGAIRGIFCITEENVRSSPGLFVRSISEKVLGVAAEASNAAKSAEEAAITAENIKSAYLYSGIGYSILAILIIVLVIIIIYLVLRYRRKKRMNKKAQYTKLLNE